MTEVQLLKMNTDASIPSIGFGTWQLAEGREAIEATKAALDAGYRLIDTAKIYANEKSVGEAIRASSVTREEIFITTKLWTGELGYATAHKAFKNSLDRLGLEYIDLYLIHWPGYSADLRRDSWKALSELYERGLIKAAGVSNFEIDHLQEIISDSSLVPAVNQIPFHPFIYSEQKELIVFCKRQGIVVEAYSPLSRGRGLDHPTIEAAARRYGKTNAQIMLRWAIQHGAVPIPKSANPGRIKENFDVFDFELGGQDMELLNSLSEDSY